MKPVAGRRINASAQLAMRDDIQKMFAAMSRELATMLVLRAGLDGIIDQREEETIRVDAREIVGRYFVDPTAYDADKVTPRSPYARILNKFYVRVVGLNVQQHQAWLKRNIPEDIYRWLTTAPLPEGLPVRETSPGATRRALIQYDPMHTWVDPNGYRLSDRIWNTADATRKAIDDLLIEGIRTGESAQSLAKKLQRFLNPEAAKVKSRNRRLSGNANALRLARTEIARAHNQAAVLAAKTNPYVDRGDIARSKRGDPKCPVCPTHATIDLNGQRVREPIPLDEISPPPYHPNDMCNFQPVPAQDVKAVTADLRRMMQAGEPVPFTPAAGAPVSPGAPTSGNRMLRWLFGSYLFSQWLKEEAA